MLIRSGGRVAYLNEQAREWFNLQEDEPDLERMARRARPSETFLSLCAQEGQARFSLDGRAVEGTSYFTPNGSIPGVLVSLRRPQWVIGAGDTASASPESASPFQPLSLLSELNQNISANLDLEATLQAILEGVEHIIPSDISEINIWDPQNNFLVPYHFLGEPGSDRRLQRSADRYTLDQGYTGYLASQHIPLLIPDVEQAIQPRPAADRQRFPIQSYLGVPLLAAGELVGSLELASFERECFSQTDLQLLQLISPQAAISIRNALLYKAEQQRSHELAGLASLAQAVSAIRNPQDLFASLNECISPLLPVEILGFLVYDENRRTLEAQAPFLGLPPSVVAWYQTMIPADSPAEEIWRRQETLTTSNAPEDERLEALGLHYLALAAGIRHTVLAPLSSSGHMLGYLQAANKQDGTPFDAEDLRLLAVIAVQSAQIIENFTLVQQSHQRAVRAETLRRIASLTSSSATLDEILKYSLQDLARLLQADMAAIFLLDEAHDELRLHKGSLFGVAYEMISTLAHIPIDDPGFPLFRPGAPPSLAEVELSEGPQVVPLFRPLSDKLGIQASIDIPMIVREHVIGELVLGSYQPGFFQRGDTLSATTAASQIASAIEQATLYSQTDQSLRQRVEQMTALTRISREINSTLDLEHLLQLVYNEALRTTQADCGTILLFELNPPSGQPPRVLLSLGDPLGASLHPLEQAVLDQGERIIIGDFAAAPSHQADSTDRQGSLPVQPAHAGIRSALIVPIAYQGQVAGLIHLHAISPDHFDPASIEISETLAVHAAIALGNAYRYQEQVRRSDLLNRRVETLSRLFETSQVLQAEQTLEQTLGSIACAIQAATPFEVVLVSVYDPGDCSLKRVAGAGIPLQTMTELRAHTQPWNGIQKLLNPEFSLGRAYFLPKEKTPDLPEDIHSITFWDEGPAQPFETPPAQESLWHPEDALLLPLLSAAGKPLGLISVDAPRNELRPDRPTIETLEIFGSQAALAIESSQKLDTLKSQAEGLQRDLESARSTGQAAQEQLPALLQKDLEQTLVIDRLSQRIRRIGAGLEIAPLLNRQNSRTEVLQIFAGELLTGMDLEAALVVEAIPGGLRLLQTLGKLGSEANIEALLGQRNPLRYCLQTGETLLVADLEEALDWKNTPLLHALEAKGFICVPVEDSSPNADPNRALPASQPREAQSRPDRSAILGLSRKTLAPFTPEDEQLVALLVRQVAAALQNLSLLSETNRRMEEVDLLLNFSRQLGSLDPDSVLHTLVESALRALPAVQAGMVALWVDRQQSLVPKAASGYANNDRLLEITYQAGEALPGQVYQTGEVQRVDDVDLPRHYNLSSENLLRYRDATAGRPPVSSLVLPIAAGRQARPLGVLVLDNFTTPAAFNPEAQGLIASLVQQTALTLENAGLYRAAQERARQLQALTRVASAITSNLQIDALIATLLDYLNATLPYDTGTLWLRQDTLTHSGHAGGGQAGKTAMAVRAARGFSDSDQRVGLLVAVEDSRLLNEMITTGQPILVADVREDLRFSPLVEYEHFSWLGLPLVASGEVIGVIALEKTEPNFYSPEHIQIATTFAGQASVGLENAALYHESVRRTQDLNERSQRLAMLNRLSVELSSSLDISHILEYAVQELRQTIACSAVSAVLFEESGQARLFAETPQTGSLLPASLPDAPLFERLHQTLGAFITQDVIQEAELAPLADFLAERRTRSLFAIPLVTGSHLHGVLLVHVDHSYGFETDEVELARTISNQVAVAVQNAGLFAETRSLTEQLEQRVIERTAQLAREHQRTQTLLHVITELSASLDLDQVLNRTLLVLNESVDAEQVTILIIRPGEKKLYRLASVGYSAPGESSGETTPFDAAQGLAGWVISQRKPVLIRDVEQDSRWASDPNAPLPHHHSAMAVPLLIGAEALGSLLLFHSSVDHFSADQLDLIQAAANQVAVAVNNAELYRLIRDQAEDLGSMLRSQQVETSRSKAILEAVADGVLVTDAHQVITLFNASAEKILRLNRSQVVGKSLEHFAGLFGRAAQAWRETIAQWGREPGAYQPGDTFTERITLENGRVVSVHLAPVNLSSGRSSADNFLGTVSIFQDITHQVEVDRLKSEFVATVSHELRTPMTSIKGYVEILLMGAAGPLNEQQNGFLEVVKTNTERLSVLVNDLLDISRIESGRVTLSLKPIRLDELAGEALDELLQRSKKDQKRVTIEGDFPISLPPVLGDLARVRQILDNLLDNAYLYNLPGGRITLRLRQTGEEVQADIQDTGLGIPANEQPRIFERFFRGETPLLLGVSGTGLGLSIVQNLVQMHQGRIWFKSNGNRGEGSQFSFTLPIEKPELDERLYG
ncbi:MAG TPA: GAF domain-containing protein [Anaerolineales bacterium]